MKARVYVTLKRGVLDPQGQAVAHALGRLGFAEVQEVRIGKMIELDLADAAAPADAAQDPRARLSEMCRGLLSNPVIEDFRIEFDGGDP